MMLSPPIRVDARKRLAKKEMKGVVMGSVQAGAALDPAMLNRAGATSDVLLPFSPDMLERKMEKVGRNMSAANAGGGSRQLIDNSMEGLRAYLSALNIRNKSKHPLFFVLRFSSCIGLLYDQVPHTDTPH